MGKPLTIRPGANKELIFDALLSSFDEGVWLWNISLEKFDVISPSTYRFFCSELELFHQSPHHWPQLIHPDDRQQVVLASTKTLFETGAINLEYRLNGKDDHQKWVKDSRKLVFDGQGRPTHIYGITKDITKQKQYKQRLEESELSSRVMFLHHPNPMWVLRADSDTILEVNEAAIKHYGYSRNEFTGKPFSELADTAIPPAKQIHNFEGLKTAQTHLKKDGTRINVLVTAASFVYRGKNAKLLLSIDVTRELEDEEKISDLNKRLNDFKYALTSSSIVSITDMKGDIIYVNDNFLRISGYERDELIGSNHNIVNSKHHPKSFFKEMWLSITKGKIWRNDIKNQAKDGSYYWVDTYVVPLLDGKGKPYQYISIRNDITSKKQTEEELAELNRQLEERVKKRTQALELANASLQDFAYSISHDLRAPVRHIRNFGQIVLDEAKDLMSEDVRKYQGYVIEASNRLSQQIEGLLQFSRVGSKLMHYHIVDTKTMVKNIIAQAKLTFSDRVCHFYVDELPEVKADEILLEQVFVNLISNAIKYSSKQPESHVWIAYNDAGSHHQFMIKDNGVGFDMAYVSKLFGMFSRLHSQSEFEGNGIGLVNVKRIVERHEGKVWVESELGKGATFYFTLSKKLENEYQS